MSRPTGWPSSIRINADNGIDVFSAHAGAGQQNCVLTWYDDLDRLTDDQINRMIGMAQFHDSMAARLTENPGGYWSSPPNDGASYGLIGYVHEGKLGIVLADGDFSSEWYGRWTWDGTTFTSQESTWANDPILLGATDGAQNVIVHPGTVSANTWPAIVSFEDPIGGSSIGPSAAYLLKKRIGASITRRYLRQARRRR